MNNPTPSWILYRAFLAVMTSGSLSAAARRLHLAHPTVRRQIEALEAGLGTVLFTRSQAGLVPTAAAYLALPHAEIMAASAAALHRAVSGTGLDDEHGVVRVTCSEVIGIEVLPPVLAGLRRSHPGLEIELVPTDRVEDLIRRDADIAVRMTKPTQSALIAQTVGVIELGLFASPSYLADHPLPRRLADLTTDHVLIGDDRRDWIITALRRCGLALDPGIFAFRTDSGLGQLAAIRAGIGIGLCQVGLAGAALRRVLPDLRFDLGTWVVMHEDLKPVRRVRLVFQALTASLRRYADSGLAGEVTPPPCP